MTDYAGYLSVLSIIKGSVLSGDVEEMKRWNNRFTGDSNENTEQPLDRDINYFVAATNNTDKVSRLVKLHSSVLF